jgi:nickel-dependent lactate racemase
VRPRPQPALPDERGALLAALEAPIGCAPLREWLRPGCKVCIIFPDITRAMPNERVLPWVLDYLHGHGVCDEQTVLLNSTGTHRPNTPAELEKMLGTAITQRYRVVNHDCEDESSLVQFGHTRSGAPALINRLAAEADVRILTGFIEPHFFAGFSGGPKALMPGVAGIKNILSNHGAENIGSPRATFGVNEGNPIWDEMFDIASRVARSFLLNVSLNEEKRITGWFAGDLRLAHRRGREFVRESAMSPVDAPFDVVITTNSGYPLDLNLYQGGKGLSAAALITKPGGTIILAPSAARACRRAARSTGCCATRTRRRSCWRGSRRRDFPGPSNGRPTSRRSSSPGRACSCTAACPTTSCAPRCSSRAPTSARRCGYSWRASDPRRVSPCCRGDR